MKSIAAVAFISLNFLSSIVNGQGSLLTNLEFHTHLVSQQDNLQ